MTPMQEILYGEFPRSAGIPSRFPLFSSDHFDSFLEKSNGRNNCYCSIARYEHPDYYCNKIFYDFDAKWDGMFGIETTPPEKFEILREDPAMAREFLGDVVEESKRLVRKSTDEGIPVIGAFTGKGIHVYQLYQEKKNPREEMLSTANRYRDELNLHHLDPKPIGDVMRISRIPNSQRIWNEVPCPLYTTPLSDAELLEMDAEWLLKTSESPSRVNPHLPKQRPEMRVYEDYLTSFGRNLPQREFDSTEAGIDDEFLQWYIKRLVKMPCVSERALTRAPEHEVRLNFVVHLFNAGLSKQAVLEVVSRLDWEDYDRETTKKQVNQIYRRGYGEFSCRRMQDEGLCVHAENPRECPTYGWRNGDECRWKL